MLLDRCADRRQIAALTEYRLTTNAPKVFGVPNVAMLRWGEEEERSASSRQATSFSEVSSDETTNAPKGIRGQ